MREREPAMKALAKRVNARGGSTPAANSTAPSSIATAIAGERRGPRNQPKRKGRK
jgi:preprotein translocase subunit SecF